MEVEEAKDPSDMSEDELRAEVWHWRQLAAERIAALSRDLTKARITGGPLSTAVIAEQLSRASIQLEDVLIGDGLEKCFACGDVLVPGQPAIRDVSEGDAHANCMGEHIEGDRYQLDPESVCDEHDDPIQGHDGVLRSHPHAPLRTTAEMVALVNEGVSATSGAAKASFS